MRLYGAMAAEVSAEPASPAELDDFRETIRGFAAAELAPRAAEIDRVQCCSVASNGLAHEHWTAADREAPRPIPSNPGLCLLSVSRASRSHSSCTFAAQTNAFPSDVNLWRAMGDMGLHGITVAEEDGGLGLGYLHHCIAMEASPELYKTADGLRIITTISGCTLPGCLSCSDGRAVRPQVVHSCANAGVAAAYAICGMRGRCTSTV